jgi:hypothetical protein
MIWLMLGQFLWTVTFVVLYAKGFADEACLGCAYMYGLVIGLLSQANTLITYAVQPLPDTLALKWFFSGVTQSVLMGALVFFIYKPKIAPENRPPTLPINF